MSTLSVQIDEQMWQQLQQIAERRQCRPDELVREVITQWLQLSEQEWQARMERLIHEFRRSTQGIDPAQIEADITDAYREYRSECAP